MADERIHAAQLPEQLSGTCYCPSCGDHLASGKCADPFAICLACKGGHRFFILPDPPNAAESAKAASLSFPQFSGLSPAGIATFWLSDSDARSVLNAQLAELLRVILEQRSVPQEPRFDYCPICGLSLTTYDQPDPWVQGLRCGSGHRWALRGGSLFTMSRGKYIELEAEHSDAVIGSLLAGWINGNPNFDTNLHQSVRRVLISSPLCPTTYRSRLG